jgi:hypothetical protein
MRLVELAKRAKGNYDSAIALQPLESTLVVLGYCAIFINIIFFILCIYWIVRRKIKAIPRLVILVNLFILPVQIWYFFFSNI